MNLHAVFAPQSIAVIGASHEVGSVGNDLVKNLATQGYAGKVFPVNPKGGELYGLAVRPNLKAIPQHVDLAVIAVPAAVVPIVLAEAGRKKIPAAVVISAGFRESGNQGAEAELVKIAKHYHITLIGPNCLGVIVPALKMNASFASVLPPAGRVAFVSQSGALGTAALDYARGLNLGFSKFISIGNKAMVGEQEILTYLWHDADTSVIMLYVEQLNDLPDLLRLARSIQSGPRPKPIIVLKSGRTAAGAAAARSHTGAIGGSEAIYQALFAQSGLIRAQSLEEFFLLADCFAHNRLPKGNRVAVVTNAGGAGVIAADQLAAEDLKPAALTPATIRQLKKILPAAAAITNPVDILGDADASRYQAVARAVLSDPQVDALLVILTPQSMTQVTATARALVECKRASRKPLVVNFIGDELVEPGVNTLEQGGVATASFPETGIQALAALQRWRPWQRLKPREIFRFRGVDKRAVHRILHRAKQDGYLLEPDILALLQAYRLPILRHRLVRSENQVAAAVQQIGAPCVLKIVSPDILHKSDVGGVLLNVTPDNALASILKLMKNVAHRAPRAKITGFLIAEQIDHGFETIIGGQREAEVGAYLLFGLGGIYTEVFKSARFGLIPLTRRDAIRLVDHVEFSPIFQGMRGQPKLDRKAVIECLGRVSQLLHDHPEISELDLNPVVVLPQGRGVRILDARLRIKPTKHVL